jgi:hypothetical protein
VDTVHSPGSSTDHQFWRRASWCEAIGCVEVALHPDQIAVRDSKRRDSPAPTYAPGERRAFVERILARSEK